MLLIIFAFLLGCTEDSIYKKEKDVVFKPREYYRSTISRDEVGAVISASKSELEKLRSQLNSEKQIKDSMILSNNGTTIIAAKPSAYFRLQGNAIESEIENQLANHGINALVTIDSDHYELAKRLVENKRDYNDGEWTVKWEQLTNALAK